jgi:hypothetical protein
MAYSTQISQHIQCSANKKTDFKMYMEIKGPRNNFDEEKNGRLTLPNISIHYD